jgi:hypothetical protein
MMFAVLIDIFISVRIRKRALVQPTQIASENKNTNRQGNLQKQMFILMFASICIFLITNLPATIYKISSPLTSNWEAVIYEISSIWTALSWFQSLNYAVTSFIDLIFIQCLFIYF